jgi:alpha/beta superfamily hydrolase
VVRVPSALVDPTAASPTLLTSDGIRLPSDLAVPNAANGGAVLLHPHPRFGGDRLNIVVDALFRALPAAGIAALRFDFRPGAGADGGDLTDERLDAAAALDALVLHVAERPLFVVGYSFGAAVGLGVRHPAVAGRVAIAPPLAMMDVSPATPLPTLVVLPEHDQYSPPAAAAPIVDDWPDTTVEVIGGADHFLTGHAAAAAELATAWLLRRLP